MMREYRNRSMLYREDKARESKTLNKKNTEKHNVNKRLYCPLYGNRLVELTREHKYLSERLKEVEDEIEKEKKLINNK